MGGQGECVGWVGLTSLVSMSAGVLGAAARPPTAARAVTPLATTDPGRTGPLRGGAAAPSGTAAAVGPGAPAGREKYAATLLAPPRNRSGTPVRRAREARKTNTPRTRQCRAMRTRRGPAKAVVRVPAPPGAEAPARQSCQGNAAALEPSNGLTVYRAADCIQRLVLNQAGLPAHGPAEPTSKSSLCSVASSSFTASCVVVTA